MHTTHAWAENKRKCGENGCFVFNGGGDIGQFTQHHNNPLIQTQPIRNHAGNILHQPARRALPGIASF